MTAQFFLNTIQNFLSLASKAHREVLSIAQNTAIFEL